MQQALTPIRDLMAHEMEFAVKIVEGGDELCPHFLAENDVGERFALFTPWPTEEAKVALIEFIRTFFHRHKVVRYVMSSEVWMVERTLEERAIDKRAPAECDDRSEHVFIVGVSYQHAPIACRRQIKRAEGEIACGPLDWLSDTPGMSFEGRMTGLLPMHSKLPPLTWDQQAQIDRIFKAIGGETSKKE